MCMEEWLRQRIDAYWCSSMLKTLPAMVWMRASHSTILF